MKNNSDVMKIMDKLYEKKNDISINTGSLSFLIKGISNLIDRERIDESDLMDMITTLELIRDKFDSIDNEMDNIFLEHSKMISEVI